MLADQHLRTMIGITLLYNQFLWASFFQAIIMPEECHIQQENEILALEVNQSINK